jgi:hypothetical protein
LRQKTCFLWQTKLRPWQAKLFLRRKKQRIEKIARTFLPAAERSGLKIDPADVLFFQDHDSQPGGVCLLQGGKFFAPTASDQDKQTCRREKGCRRKIIIIAGYCSILF